MKKFACLFLMTVILLLTACLANDPEANTRQEVIASLKDQGLTPKEQLEKWGKKVFGMKLNKVRPSAYVLEGKDLYVYIYPSTAAQEQGLDDWRDKTASIDTVSYQVYEANNVMLFYVYAEEYLNSDIDREIQAALDLMDGN